VWQDATSGDFTVSSSIGKSLYTSGNAPGAASGIALVGSNVGAASSVTGAVGSVTGNVGGNVVGSVGSISGVTFPSGFSTLTTTTIAAANWGFVVDSVNTARQYLRAIGATTAGNATGGPGSPAFKSLDGLTTYVTSTADSSGDRSNTYNL